MQTLGPVHWPELRGHFLPDQPGPLIGLHAIHTGCGACWVDRWPQARATLVFTGGNLTCCGDPDAMSARDLAGIVQRLLHDWERVFIEVRPELAARFRKALPELLLWPRAILVRAVEHDVPCPPDAEVRRLIRADTSALGTLGDDIRWISDTHGGAGGMAESETAWGAFVNGRLVAAAVPFFVGDRYEDIGVVTEAAFRGRGLSPACAARVIADIRARGRTASWSTSPENTASLRVAEKLGFVKQRDDVLYVAGKPLPGMVAAPPLP